MPPRRTIFHVDVNSAFLSWTAVKLAQEGQDDIRLVPSVVSGDPSDRRSIITAASIPAKKLGIKTTMPVSMALRICPSLIIVKGDWAWYKRCSDAFMDICRSYSPVMEKFSIDECFLDMTMRLGGRDPVEVANELRTKIRDNLLFTVNVGVGSNKLLAKMASDFEKPDKVHTLWEEEVPRKMWPLGVRDLLWVGKKTEGKLIAYGLRTIGDLAQVSSAALSRIVGKKFASQLHDNANGIDASEVETEVQEAKSYSAERTLEKDVVDRKALDRILFKVTCVVCHRLRRDDFRAFTVSVFLKYNDFSVIQKQTQMAQASSTTAIVLGVARTLLDEIWDHKTPVRQVGLSLGKLTHENYYQYSLFGDPDMEYYMEWDRLYDEKMKIEGDGRLKAYERVVTTRQLGENGKVEVSQVPLPEEKATVSDKPSKTKKSLQTKGPDGVPVFLHPDWESALAAAKKSVRSSPSYFMERKTLRSGEDCFEISEGATVVERHKVGKMA